MHRREERLLVDISLPSQRDTWLPPGIHRGHICDDILQAPQHLPGPGKEADSHRLGACQPARPLPADSRRAADSRGGIESAEPPVPTGMHTRRPAPLPAGVADQPHILIHHERGCHLRQQRRPVCPTTDGRAIDRRLRPGCSRWPGGGMGDIRKDTVPQGQEGGDHVVNRQEIRGVALEPEKRQRQYPHCTTRPDIESRDHRTHLQAQGSRIRLPRRRG